MIGPCREQHQGLRSPHPSLATPVPPVSALGQLRGHLCSAQSSRATRASSIAADVNDAAKK